MNKDQIDRLKFVGKRFLQIVAVLSLWASSYFLWYTSSITNESEVILNKVGVSIILTISATPIILWIIYLLGCGLLSIYSYIIYGDSNIENLKFYYHKKKEQKILNRTNKEFEQKQLEENSYWNHMAYIEAMKEVE